MDGAALSRFPHLSWLGYHFEVEPGTPCTCSWSLHQTAHALHFVIDGGGPVSWIHRGKEVRYAMRANSFHYLPADQDRHGIVANVPQGVRSYTLFLPMRHLDEAVAAENMGRRVEYRWRICASLELLKDQSVSLAHAALDLGFSSQSHFTRLFSDLTSMTPARYQKQFKRVMCRRGVATRPAWVPVARE